MQQETKVTLVCAAACQQYLDTGGSVPKSLVEAVSILKQSLVCGFPTETVYGLAANALDAAAVTRIYKAKGRPSDNPLIVHVSDLEMLSTILATQLPEIYKPLVAQYWPGPLTILLPKSDLFPFVVTGGHDTVAVRMPASPIARALIKACGFPLAAPSANISGRPSPTLAAHVYSDLNGKIPLILDGGACDSGVESTVLDALGPIPSILRPGGITLDQIWKCPGFQHVRVWKKDYLDPELEEAPTTPGMKYLHYKPDADVIVVRLPESGDAKQIQRALLKIELEKITQFPVGVLMTGKPASTPIISDKIIEIHLGESSHEVAHGLFKGLRDLESLHCKTIFVEGITDHCQGLAVMNRILKAASLVI